VVENVPPVTDKDHDDRPVVGMARNDPVVDVPETICPTPPGAGTTMSGLEITPVTILSRAATEGVFSILTGSVPSAFTFSKFPLDPDFTMIDIYFP